MGSTTKPVVAIGDFFAMALDTVVLMFTTAVRLARVAAADMVRGASVDLADDDAVDSLHGADGVHPQHSAGRIRRRRLLRNRRGAAPRSLRSARS